MKTKRRHGLVLWILFLLLLGALACYVFYQYLADYEISRPEPVMDRLMEEMSPDDWYQAVKSRGVGGLSEFEDPAALLEEYYQSRLRQARFSYRRDTVRSDPLHAVFVVRAGNVNFATVTLGPAEGGQLRFGRHLWAVESIEPEDILSTLQGVSVEILTYPGQEVFLNGKPLGEGFLRDEAAPCPSLSALERRFPVQPKLWLYRIERMVGDISVTTGSGLTLQPEESGSVVRFDASGEALHRVELFAPSDVELSICGAALLPEEAVSRSPGILEGLEEFTGADSYDTLHYVFEGLYTQPVVTARDSDGSLLEPVVTPGGILHFYHADDPAYAVSATPIVSDFFSAYTRYATSAFSQLRQNALLSKILPESELYPYIYHSKDTMIWAVGTTVNEFQDLQYTDFHRLNDKCFVCNVRYRGNFTMNARQGAINYDEENVIELCFVRLNAKYYCAEMRFVTD